jgi:hypothetical protein
MGLFDNPEYFRANAINENNSSTAHESLMIIESSPVNASNENHQQESIKSSSEMIGMKKYDEKMASTPLLCEKGIENVNNEYGCKRSLLIVKIILTVIFGSLINQSVSFLLPFSLIQFNRQTDMGNWRWIYLLYSIISGMSALSYSFFIYFIWRPKKKWLYLVSAILSAQLVLYGLYFIFKINKYINDHKNKTNETSTTPSVYFKDITNSQTIVCDSILNVVQLISIILVFIETRLIK